MFVGTRRKPRRCSSLPRASHKLVLLAWERRHSNHIPLPVPQIKPRCFDTNHLFQPPDQRSCCRSQIPTPGSSAPQLDGDHHPSLGVCSCRLIKSPAGKRRLNNTFFACHHREKRSWPCDALDPSPQHGKENAPRRVRSLDGMKRRDGEKHGTVRHPPNSSSGGDLKLLPFLFMFPVLELRWVYLVLGWGFFSNMFLNPGIFMFPAQVAVSESPTTGSSF